MSRLKISPHIAAYEVWDKWTDFSGVYKIHNSINSKVYIGSAGNLRKRRNGHLSFLRRGQHPNKHLQGAWDKYGESAFKFRILEYAENMRFRLEQEQFWMDYFQAQNREYGYNMCPKANGTEGRFVSEETKRKLSNVHKGRPLTKEHRAKIGVANKGRKFSKEHCTKLSVARKGQIISKDAREKQAMALKGRKHTRKARKKMSVIAQDKSKTIVGKQQLENALKAWWKKYHAERDNLQLLLF